MKKLLLSGLGLLTLTLSVYASSPLDFQYIHSMNKARSEYDKVQLRLTNAAKLINRDGESSFKQIEEENSKHNTGIFVIDPTTGKLLVAPSSESIGKDALKNAEINGKAIAREAIIKARTEIYGSTWDSWVNSVGKIYSEYITEIALTLDGRVYALAIGKSNKTLQRLFVTKIVDSACQSIKEIGPEKSFELFNRKNSIYRFADTYIFVYELKSKNNIVCLYNPNYPQYKGKNMVNYKVKSGYVIKEVYNKLQDSDSSWIHSDAVIPGTEKMKAKDIYVKAVEKDGVKYAVGSGIYLAD